MATTTNTPTKDNAMTISADRPLDIETASPGTRRATRIDNALQSAQMALSTSDLATAARDLAFIERQVSAAEGAIDADLAARVDCLRLLLGASAAPAPAPIRIAPPVAEKVTSANVVAGARAEGSGILVGWWGSGELSRAQILGVLDRAGLPAEWAPAVRGAHGQAGHAVAAIGTTGLVVRAERNSAKAGVVRGWRARWTVGKVDHTAMVGDRLGAVVLTATLIGDELEVGSSDSTLKARVEIEFARRVGAEMYAGGDVTGWLLGILRGQFGAVGLGKNYYVPARHVAACEKLLQEVALTGWGVDWMGSLDFPAIPVATTAQLRRGLASGLVAESAAILAELEEAQDAARKAGKSKIGIRAATNMLGRLRDVGLRATSMASVLGDDVLGNVRAAIAAAVAVVEPLCDETSQRGALIFDEISDR